MPSGSTLPSTRRMHGGVRQPSLNRKSGRGGAACCRFVSQPWTWVSQAAALGLSAGTAVLDTLNNIFSEIQSVNSVFASVSLPISVNTQGTFLNKVYVGMFRPDAGIIQPGRNRMRIQDLPVTVLQQVRQIAVQYAWATSAQASGMLACGKP